MYKLFFDSDSDVTLEVAKKYNATLIHAVQVFFKNMY